MLTPEALNALPGWTGVAFLLFWVVKTLVDLLKAKIEGGKHEKSEKSEPVQPAKDLGISIARIEVRVDHLEGMIERLDDRVADLIREISTLKGRGDRP